MMHFLKFWKSFACEGWFSIGLDLKRTQEEARQPGEDIASYLNGNVITNEHKRRQSSEERISHHI